MDRKLTFDFSFRTVFTVILTLGLVWLAFYLRDIIVLFFISFILATALDPAVNFMEKKKVPRWVSIIGFYALIGFFIYTLIRLIIPPMTTQIQHLIQSREYLADRIAGYFSSFPPTLKDGITEYVNTLPNRFAELSTGQIVPNVLGVFSGLLGVLTVFVATFYLLMERNGIERALEDYWPEKSKEKVVKIFRRMSLKMSLWVRGQVILSGAIGLLTFIGLSLLNVDYALTLALIAAVTELLPVIGPYIGAFPAIVIALSVSPILALWVAILYLGIQQFEAQVLVPQVMKRAVGLSPVTIIFSLLIGAKLLGFLGVIIAVPVASAISVLFETFNNKKSSKNQGTEG